MRAPLLCRPLVSAVVAGRPQQQLLMLPAQQRAGCWLLALLALSSLQAAWCSRDVKQVRGAGGLAGVDWCGGEGGGSGCTAGVQQCGGKGTHTGLRDPQQHVLPVNRG